MTRRAGSIALVAGSLSLLVSLLAALAPAASSAAGAATRPASGGVARTAPDRRRIGRTGMPDPAERRPAQPGNRRTHPSSPNSAAYVASIGLTAHLHPDFGTNPSYGIPYSVVGPRQPKVPIKFTEFGDESDPGPYPIPPKAPIEGGGARGSGDRHVLVVQEGSCMLYELYSAQAQGRGMARGLRRRLQPAQRRAAARRMDLRGRRRTADLPAARPLPGGSRRADRPRAARDRAAARRAATSIPRPTSRPAARTPTCRRWACDCA